MATASAGAIGDVEAVGSDTVEAPRDAVAAEAVAEAPRRRGRAVLTVAVAAVLGVIAGTCTGYVVQAGREPTPLPPLSQPVVGQAKGEVEPLSAAQDRKVRTDGDLRKLLVSRPKGVRDTEVPEGWMDISEYAESYDRPANAFTNLNGDEFRRVATTSWREGETFSAWVYLAQFREDSKIGASEWAGSGVYWAEKTDDTRSWPLPGTGDGMAYVHDTPERKAGYLPLYAAEAHAWRGDICMEIWLYDSRPIPKQKIMDLAERQVGKL
ncbi:hypothetical protein [Streptomyces sp. NPDC002588]|uniref:hypothetical protein n=1 Tax=Streptomyces sp. NPDC002588 TaxID=3154419 RepID=UPI00331D5BC2